MKLVDIQATARKRDPATGERYRWRTGPYADLLEVDATLAFLRALHGRRVRFDVIPYRGPRRAIQGTTP